MNPQILAPVPGSAYSELSNAMRKLLDHAYVNRRSQIECEFAVKELLKKQEREMNDAAR